MWRRFYPHVIMYKLRRLLRTSNLLMRCEWNRQMDGQTGPTKCIISLLRNATRSIIIIARDSLSWALKMCYWWTHNSFRWDCSLAFQFDICATSLENQFLMCSAKPQSVFPLIASVNPHLGVWLESVYQIEFYSLIENILIVHSHYITATQ